MKRVTVEVVVVTVASYCSFSFLHCTHYMMLVNDSLLLVTVLVIF